jgi:ABC-type transport system involved in multi-copper enzyme maturation permease subunit
MTILVIGAVLIFGVVSFLMMSILDNSDSGFVIGIVVSILFVVLFANLTPSTAQMVENDYYAMMEDRPKCIDAGDVSLGCKKDYIDWQKDSIEKQRKYDSVKVKLENLMIKSDTIRVTVVKNDTHEIDSVKTCIEQCWNLILNSDIKQCQDECFK